jgi:hypothetical protein
VKHPVEKHVTAELARLGSFVKLVGLAEGFQDVIESVQERDPVVEIASREGPSCRECGEMLWE